MAVAGWRAVCSTTRCYTGVFFFSSRRRHTRSVSAFLLNRSSDLYFMQRYHDVISSFGGKTSYDADNRPLLVMRSNLWASGYDVDGTDHTSLGQFSGRVQQTYKHSVPRFFVPEHGTMLDRKSGSAGMPRPISYAVFCLKKKKKTENRMQ